MKRAARHWAEHRPGERRRDVDAGEEKAAIAADLAALGSSPEEVMAEWQVDRSAGDRVGEVLALPVECEPVVRAFLIGVTQWRWMNVGVALPMGGVRFDLVPLGFDYAGLRAGCAMARLRLTAEQFDGVQIMEGHALALLARRRS